MVRVCLLFAVVLLAPAQSATYSVAFSTYFGGSNFEQVRDVTTDAAGNIYITGGTGSTDFPTTTGAYQRSNAGWFDVFVVKFSPTGSVIWSTLLGGPNYDRAYGIEVDNAGYVYLSGRSGPGFPVTSGSLQATYQGYYTGSAYGDQNAFIAKLKPDGSGLVWATYFGTAGMNRDFDINRATGEVWVASTYEPGAGQSAFKSAWFSSGFRTTPVGGADNVVAKVSAAGTQVLWATYVGGSGDESGKNSLRVDGSGNVHLLTNTNSTNMPLANAYQATMRGVQDFYLAKIRADGGALLFGTYFGGSDSDWCETHHLALDGGGNVFISGITHSTDLPTTPGAFQRIFGGINGVTNFHATGDGYVAKFSPTGALLASSYLGGRYGDGAQGLACDAAGNVYFCGGTVSDNLPVTAGAYQTTMRGVEDFMAVKMSADLSQVLYCSYIGSTVYDEGRVCWADADGTFYMAGESAGTNWPVLNAAQPAYGGGTGDNILVKFTPPPAGPDSDGDGLPDAWELSYWPNLNQGAAGDPDADGLTNAQEHAAGTNPTVADTDGDGMSDGFEVNHGLDPLLQDQDGNGTPDGADDWDGDGTPNATDSTPGLPGSGGGSSGGGSSSSDDGSCGATGLEVLVVLALAGLIQRR
jgi:hypothetical protein